MKKLLALLAACALLAAGTSCQKQPDAPDGGAPDAPKTETVALYVPDDQAMYVVPTETEIQVTDTPLTPANLIDALVEAGALPEDTQANSGHAVTGGTVTVDLNQAFLDAVTQNGTAGETLLMAAVVDTLLDYFDASEVTVTANGAVIETGHAVYDEPFTAVFATEDAQ